MELPDRPTRAPDETEAILACYRALMATPHPETGLAVGRYKGVYVLYDYLGEPAYVGQTDESLSSRLGRHLTGQRSDIIAKGILYPDDVLSIKVWPLPELDELSGKGENQKKRAELLKRAEYTAYLDADRHSSTGVPNEKDIEVCAELPLGFFVEGRIVPDGVYARRCHADVIAARKAHIVMSITRTIEGRRVGKGLRKVAAIHATRLHRLLCHNVPPEGSAVPDDALDSA